MRRRPVSATNRNDGPAAHLPVPSGHSQQPSVPHLIHILPSFGIGGQQIRLTHVVNRLAERWRHTVVSLDGITTARTLVGETANLTVEVWNEPKHRVPRPRLLRQFCAFLKGLNPTVLLTYNWGATEWALANRICCRRPVVPDTLAAAGEKQLAALLRENRSAAHKSEALATTDLERVAVDARCSRKPSFIRPLPC